MHTLSYNQQQLAHRVALACEAAPVLFPNHCLRHVIAWPCQPFCSHAITSMPSLEFSKLLSTLFLLLLRESKVMMAGTEQTGHQEQWAGLERAYASMHVYVI